ncbi:HAMP domain-containing protein [Anaerobacillus sp. HL2]|nr:HAMP domain-containing protein [Anaerobacillus sp. HL2]
MKSHDEIGQLGETFNYMANELASLDTMRKRICCKCLMICTFSLSIY